MTFTPEIKKFIRNTVILTVIFAVVINFSWEYFAAMLGYHAQAQNDENFEKANIVYVGNTATAFSLRVGGIKSENNSLASTDNTISIAEVLSNPTGGQQKLIASNMIAVTAYANALKTNILELVDSSNNRASALDNHISLLKSYYVKTQDRLAVIADQKAELKAILSESTDAQGGAKTTLQNSYTTFDYSWVDGAIDDYLSAKNVDARARIYMIYLDRFEKSYTALQNKNKKVLDAIVNNRDGIIKQNVVVIPDTGSDIVKELWLIQSEADYKAKKALE